MASPLLKPVPCDICDNAAAKFHCNTCGDALCPTCKSHHLKSRGTRNHDIVPYAQKLSPKYLAGLFCHTHKANTPEYWCDTCGVPICGPCITKEHRGHQFSNINTVLSQRRDALLEEMKTLRDKKVGEWEVVLKEAKMITADYAGNIDMIEKELVERAKKMHAQVDAILSQSKKTLHQMKTTNLNKLQDQEKYISDRLQKMKEDVARYEDQLKYADPSALLQFKQGIAQDEAKPQSLETAPIPVFTKGNDDVNSMEKMFGQLSIPDLERRSTAESSASSCSTQKWSSNSKDAQRSLIPKPSVQYELDVNTNHPHIACVGQGRAWVVTRERQLQLMNRDGSATDTINTQSNFFITDMALTSYGDILLADHSNKCIKSVSTQKEITTLFSTSGESWGLCSLPNNDIVVTFNQDRKVIVYSRDGKVRRPLDKIKFRYPYKVAVNKVNQDICICDHETYGWDSEGKLMAVGADSQLKYEYSGQSDKKFYPVGVCTDQMGHVLVADYKNHDVHILDQEGQFIQYILTSQQGLHDPVTIDIEREGYVWVGEYVVHKKGRVKVARYLH